MRATQILQRHELHVFQFFRRFVKLAGGEKRICEYNQARTPTACLPRPVAAADGRLRRSRRRRAD